MSEFTRRSFIGKTAVAIGSFAALQKVVGADRSRSDPGPANQTLDGQNPDSIWPPATDSKSLVQNFKYPFSFANKRTYEGGWSREVTVRELPVWIRVSRIGSSLLHDSTGSGRKKIFAIVAPPMPADLGCKTIRRILIFDTHPDSLRLISRLRVRPDVDLVAARRAHPAHLMFALLLMLALSIAMFWPLIVRCHSL